MGLLLLVRHGESVWNRDRVVQGQDGPGLTGTGHEQARHVGRWLADEVDDDVAFACSDLVRCRETAAPFAEALGRQPVLDTRLRERHFGRWQGLQRDEVRRQDPVTWGRFAEREDVVEEVGGESTPTLVGRVLPALRELASAAPLTVVVTHGGPVWHGSHALLSAPEPTLGPVSNASVTVLDVPDEGPSWLLSWNQVGHLPRDLRTAWPPARA